MTELQPHKFLHREIRKLKVLYNGTIYSYSKTAHEIKQITKVNKDFSVATKPLYLEESNEETQVAGNLFEYENKLKSGYATYLRKILFTRLISILEVYLIDVTREIFLRRKELFHEDSKIEFSYSEILSSDSITSIWTKIINKKCRQLQNQGFLEVKKFYLKNFAINFSDSPTTINKLEFLHDSRHLIIHRLGKVDKQFEHKYNYSKSEVDISEADFYTALKDIQNFAKFINAKALEVINYSTVKSKSFKVVPSLVLNIHWLSDKEPIIFSNDFSFIGDESIYRFSDIVTSYKNHENVIEVELKGPLNALKSYLKELRKYANLNELKILKQKLNGKDVGKVSDILIKQIIALLPKEKPFPKDVHKEVAEKLNLKEKTVYHIIGSYLKYSTQQRGFASAGGDE